MNMMCSALICKKQACKHSAALQKQNTKMYRSMVAPCCGLLPDSNSFFLNEKPCYVR